MRLRIPVLLGEFALMVLAIVAMIMNFEQIAAVCAGGIAATLSQLVDTTHHNG